MPNPSYAIGYLWFLVVVGDIQTQIWEEHHTDFDFVISNILPCLDAFPIVTAISELFYILAKIQ